MIWAGIVKWVTGSLAGELRRAYEARLRAANETERLVADAAIKDIERQIDERRGAREIRLATAAFWEMRLISAIIAGCFTLHLALVTLDTCFHLGWRVARFPSPFDEWQGVILLSFFGVQAVSSGINAIAAAIRGRK